MREDDKACRRGEGKILTATTLLEQRLVDADGLQGGFCTPMTRGLSTRPRCHAGTDIFDIVDARAWWSWAIVPLWPCAPDASVTYFTYVAARS